MSDRLQLRQQVVEACRQLNRSGLNQGTSGNVSVREGNGLIITPSGLAYEQMSADDLVYMDLQGHSQGRYKPSSEWRFHRDILAQRPDINAVIHTHSTFATTLACLHQEIPAFHYMIALAGGSNIRCAPYATFGTQALSDHALQALKERKACLLANHGLIVVERDLERALYLLAEVEKLCEIYWRALQVAPPPLIDEAEMHRMVERFKTYGQTQKQ